MFRVGAADWDCYLLSSDPNIDLLEMSYSQMKYLLEIYTSEILDYRE